MEEENRNDALTLRFPFLPEEIDHSHYKNNGQHQIKCPQI